MTSRVSVVVLVAEVVTGISVSIKDEKPSHSVNELEKFACCHFKQNNNVQTYRCLRHTHHLSHKITDITV